MTNGTGKPKHLQEFAMTAKGRDLELCSGGEDDEYLEVEIHSPTDSSEDSVEVKVSPICLRNKRKCAEPRKVQDAFTAPLKKRMCLQAKNEQSTEPFRPWNAENTRSLSPSSKLNVSKDIRVPLTNVTSESSSFAVPHPPHLTPDDKFLIRPSIPSSQVARTPSPIPLIKKTISTRHRKIKTEPNPVTQDGEIAQTQCDPLRLRVPLHPQLTTLNSSEAERFLVKSAEAFPNLQSPAHSEEHHVYGRKEQRNYKNMTRERRIEANARERTRVHTISAAFDTLRKAVPAYSHNQKLSKLSVLRIACSYIMTLSTLVDNSSDNESGSSSSLAECVDTVSKTIQKEGKLRKKKDEVD
ncbi:hypothetical protein RN001_013757 [Aquatica leii]|uniref:BHLH domain-containing protein n=1 Tax=Aquatica leii TaxID=1421715 RepID=A0AAN7SCJ1_9COLE|nr:hypothetical protein RN001_013757 [Aquatica leii]